MRERSVKATIFRRREPRPSVRIIENRESAGAFPVLDGRVAERVFITGPVSAARDAPVRRVAERDRSLWSLITGPGIAQLLAGSSVESRRLGIRKELECQ